MYPSVEGTEENHSYDDDSLVCAARHSVAVTPGHYHTQVSSEMLFQLVCKKGLQRSIIGYNRNGLFISKSNQALTITKM
jgi:hypothetical protein